MQKLKFGFLLFIFSLFIFEQKTVAMLPESFGSIENELMTSLLKQKEAIVIDKDSKYWKFISKKFVDNTKYSKKQAALVLIPFIALLAGCQYAAYYMRNHNIHKYPKLVKLPSSKSPKPDISLLLPLIPTAVIPTILFAMSKTDVFKGEKFTNKETVIGSICLYLISLALMNGEIDYLSVKTRMQMFGESNDERKNTFVSNKYLKKVPDTLNWAKAYLLLPLIPSTFFVFVIHNLITKHNVKNALKEFLDNYNPDITKDGLAYSRQTADTKNKIEISNYKTLTHVELYPVFDELYKEYTENGNIILPDMIKKVAGELKKLEINIG